MTHLNIQQDLNISELVTTKLIQKLYDNALSVPKPSGKNPDNAYMSGKLEVPKAYKSQVLYLAGNINGEPNASGRFPDLRIDVTSSYYINFEDSAVLNVLLANNIGSDGIGVTEAEAANATFTMGFFENNTDITSFNTFNLFTKANTNPPISLFKLCTNLASVNLSNITTIGQEEFNNCNKLNVSLNLSGLTSLGYKAFGYSGITSITNLGSITSIPDECFRGCTSLTSVTLPSTVISIGLWAFADCHMTTMDLSHVTSIGEEAFVNSWLTTTDLSNVTSIGPSAFRGSRLTGTLNCPNLVSLGNSAFQLTNITSILSLGSVTSIPNSCFRETNIQSISIPNGISLVGDFAFLTSKATITSIDIPTSINSIGMMAFGEINSLSSCIYLPNVTSVGNNVSYYAFCFVYLGLYSTIGQMYFPNLTTTGSEGYGTDQYRHGLFCSIRSNLVYLKNISDLYPGAFSWSNIDAIVINNDNPPILRDSTTSYSNIGGQTVSIFNNMGTYNSNTHTSTWGGFIYVPDNAVTTYLTWANNITGISSSKIKSMNELPRFATKDAWVLGGRQIGLIEEYM